MTNNIRWLAWHVFRNNPRGKRYYRRSSPSPLSPYFRLMHRPTCGPASSLALTLACIFIKYARASDGLLPAGKSESGGKRERKKKKTIKIGGWGRHDANCLVTRTDVVYFHGRLTSAPEHQVEESVTTRRDVRCQR